MSLARDLRAVAGRLGSRTALRVRDEAVSYAELDARADRRAAGLQALGLEPGDRVALLLGNTTAFVESLYGAWRAGLIAVPLNTASTAHEVSRIVADARPGALLVDGPRAEVGAAVDGVRVVAVARARGDGEPPEAEAPDGTAALAYTAGTTGRAKGAVLSHANLRANHEQLSGSRHRLREDDVVLGALPLFHIYGLNVALAYTLASGAEVLLLERFEAAGSLAAIAEHRATVILGVPPMYRAWLAADAPDVDLSSVRLATSGAAPLDPALASAFTERFGVSLWEGYGLTETAPVLTTAAMGDRPRPGSVGRPLPGVSIRLRDDGAPVAPGEPGEIEAQGPNVFSGYWGDEQATRAAFTPDGWFRTGDVGYARDGELFLVDRRDDLIIVNGFNVYPREVEEVLAGHPAVAAVAVVGVPSESSGEAVKAVVVARAGEQPTADALIAHCRGSLARFKCPVAVEFASELPLLPTGKVLRRELRGDDPG